MNDSRSGPTEVTSAGTVDNDQAEITAHPAQAFGSDPLTVRDTDHYTNEYVKGFVEKWDDLIDWKKRYESEGSFFVDLLKSRGVKSVLDVATGTGFHSVRLIEEGFDTVSVDGSAEMLAKAFENGLNYGGHILRVVHADWRWLNRDVHGEFDAVVCLGNSFTHLFSERDRRKALAEFYAVLKHDGILILDQRNYDSILDNGFSSKHTYYYCGEEVTAEPEYVDDGLARFRYRFPDDSQYHLNMFPLRKDYVRRLLREVGFQRVETYGDFQETFTAEDPDFLIHVAEKSYVKSGEESANYSAVVNVARDYYNSDDADNFYYTIWGGEDIHVGLYQTPDEPIAPASVRTVERMASKLALSASDRVLDIGAGYGGAARYLAKTYGCRVTCLNLSEVENERNRAYNAEQGLADLIDVVDGSFEDLPFEDNEFDVVWSQDAMLHSGDRVRVLQEVTRVLKPRGQFVFTDPMAADNCDKAALRPILERLHLDSMGSPGFYERELHRLGMSSIEFEDHTPQLATHYGRVLEETQRRHGELSGSVSSEYLTRMKTGLKNWVEGGRAGNLAWGIFHVRA
ncbi:sarcosine/dimethylglycine N-methyltransferase [Saccharomonospora amisosensis]|uniref:Sarcosine/dimethylglycine N-methyltransferase n=1 Tax=Saccharomonospora amisosensis TaxID=1128677 RepID=A0A7X5ZQ20_9PSEU|nr:class I SAM-dependent methyltransferase [Saccharomonospora amisosensis]NIJ11348.1 sarcosine/dimethylglycine N-methyltransferase [Saccharomonospora amisosensis]